MAPETRKRAFHALEKLKKDPLPDGRRKRYLPLMYKPGTIGADHIDMLIH